MWVRQELQGVVDDLHLELEKKEEEYENLKKRDDRIRKRMDNENHELRRKAALGWMLGCLSGKKHIS
jgi:tetrahydromethanopterin S-methyltransferase subunit G